MRGIGGTVFVCIFVFLAGFVDSIGGGGGLISLPAYIASGIPVHMALGTNKFSSSCGSLISCFRYIRGRKVNFWAVAASVPCALAGSMLGARIVQLVGDMVLKVLLIGIIPVAAFLVLRKKDFGKESKEHSVKRILLISGACGLGIGFYDGFFGPGAGTFLILAYTAFLGFDLVSASGNAKIVNLASNVGAVAVFIRSGNVFWAMALPSAVCGILGNFIGSGLAIKKGGKIIKPIFLLALLLLGANVMKDVAAAFMP